MKIGFDVSQTAEEKAGCGYVADQLIRSLTKVDRDNEYILYPTFYSYRNPSFQNSTNPEGANCTHHFEKMSFKEMRRGWETQMTDRTSWLGSPDIVHCNNFSCIKDHGAKIVYTLYDLTPFICPQFLTEPNRLICSEGLFNAAIYADSCIAISENTKKDFLHFFPHYPEDRITVIPLGIRPGIKPAGAADLKRKIMEKYKIKGEFWLSVGTIEPRKNYKLLIDAYAKLQDDKFLAIAGGKGWLESDMGRILKRSGMDSKIKFLGYVPDKELSVLYSSCFAFIYPSFYEGFGLPVLEAMSCGAAVISSNSGSLREVGGEASRYIDPTSEKDLVEQMSFLTDNPEKRKECQAKSLEQAKKFTWEKAVEIVLDVYEKTLKHKPYFPKK
jgi:glycosyltransferase involved in cell wall biosynthesis